MRYLSVYELVPGLILGEDIFLPYKPHIPYVTKHSILTAAHIAALREQGVGLVLITDHIPKPRRPEIDYRTLKPKPTVPHALRRQSVETLKDLFELADKQPDNYTQASRLVSALDSVVEQLVDTVARDPRALINIEGLRSYDEYTYHHSLSVSVLSIATAQALGMPVRELRRLGLCAIMHDIGKTSIPLSVINKPDPLTDEEYTLMKSHSEAGLIYLMKASIGDSDMHRGVLHHHERVDGKGYPHELMGEAIPLWSRIIAVADVYDALTSKRPYRTPMSPADAAEYIMAGTYTAFDYNVVMAFLSRIEIYPTGQLVQLSSGAEAKVVRSDHTLRPVVQLPDGEVLDLLSDRKYLSTTIKDVLHTPKAKS